MNTIKPMPADLYHADHSAWSRSMLSTFRESKREAFLRYVEKSAPPESDSRSMKLGSLAHTLLLEPQKAKECFAIIPDELLASNGAVSTKAAKAFVQECEGAGKTAIKQCQWDESSRIIESLRKTCGKWIDKAAHIEHAIYWKDETTGLMLKARPDWIVHTADSVFVFDIKTTTRIIPHTFTRSFENYEYYLQDVHYRQGVAAVTGWMPKMYFVGVEQAWPFRSAIYELSEDSRAKSFECWRYLVNDLAKAIESNQWDDPWEKDITVLNLKDYVFRSAS